ncbi:MAG: hypothetical protein RIQ51_1141 [Bacteroidota bacterium]|jgi:hypothetical protein
MSLNPQFPLYIPSKGRHEYMITSKVLTELGVKHFIVVEPQQVDDYQRAVKNMNLLATILPLDMSYKDKYELCDDFGLTKSTGPGPARNFAWDHSIKNGFAWHWVMDDNITSFRRLNKNEKVKVSNGSIFKAMEDFVLRYKNIAMAGPNYYMFAPARVKQPPFIMNTRIYSCNLIRNDLAFRWRGRYNEDTIISLDMLKAGWCTVQFNAFLQQKMPTQTIGGGNTQEFYHAEGTVQAGQKYADTGTLAKSQMQVKVHPDVSKLVWKFNRYHHHVDYTPFKKQKLIRKEDIEIPKKPNEYGMNLKKIKK